MLVGYCIRRRADPPVPEGLIGLHGEPVRLIEGSRLALWGSQGEPGPPSVEAMRIHDAVVRAALASATPLPLRFGTAFRDEAATLALLEERHEEFLASLDRVAGCVEMGIRVAPSQPPAPPPADRQVHSGREFLEMRRDALLASDARRALSDRMLDAILAPFAPLDIPVVRTLSDDPSQIGTLAFLVRKEELGAYRRCADSARDAAREVTLHFSGPWAPYSFV